MHGSFLQSEMRRVNRNMLLVNLGVVLGVLLLGYVNYRYLYNCFAGPFPTAPAVLHAIPSPHSSAQYFVTVEGEELLDSGYQAISIERDKYTKAEKRRKVTADYLVLVVQQRLLLLKAPVGWTSPKIDGVLTERPGQLSTDIAKKLRAARPDLPDIFLPYMLDAADDFRTAGYVGAAIAVSILLLCTWNLRKWQQRTQNPQVHPVMCMARQYGPEFEVASQIDQELAAASARYGACRLTASWLLQSRLFYCKMVKLADIVWAYKLEVRHSHNFIPTGKSYALVLYTRQQQKLEHSASKKHVEALLSALMERVPTAVFGYSEDLQKLWRQQPDMFIHSAKQRRAA